ncbi:hypothetical protein EON64_20015 [archaeon]|nr:MAG: hypothetical protein EON64_20015 [archaeon]
MTQAPRILAFENFFYVASALGVQGEGPEGGAGRGNSSSRATVFPLVTTPQKFLEASEKFCNSDWKDVTVHYPLDSQEKDVNKKACFLGVYAYGFLVEGLRIPSSKRITIQKDVAGSEIEWALGAAYKEAAGFLKRTNLRPT